MPGLDLGFRKVSYYGGSSEAVLNEERINQEALQ